MAIQAVKARKNEDLSRRNETRAEWARRLAQDFVNAGEAEIGR